MAIFDFPGTNFHELNLDWLLGEMKKCLEEWETVKGQFTSLQEYVTNYFANLDVSDEISAKLDEMAQSGELLEIASSLIQSTTTNYLASVITNPNSPPLDRTLTQATAAAPADMVGDIKEDSIPIKGVPDVEEMASLISHITESGRYQIRPGDAWQDRPAGTNGGALMVYQYGENYVVQVMYTFDGAIQIAHYRIVHKTTFAVFKDWAKLSVMWNRTLTTADNLDDITAEGVYRWSDGAHAPVNSPINANAFLLVLASLPATRCVQICISGALNTNVAFAIRGSDDNQTNWTPWVFLAGSSSMIPVNGTYRVQNELNAETDLNTIVNVGSYWYSSSNIPVNAPAIPYGGIITVIGSASNTTQKIQVYSGYGINDGTTDSDRRQIAYRTFAANVWSPWRYIKTESTPYASKLLTATDNLDTVTAEGLYKWTAGNTAPANSPIPANAFLLVLTSFPVARCVQVCISASLNTNVAIAVRGTDDNQANWSPWVFLAGSSSMIPVNGTYRVQNELNAETDLNTIVNVGSYWYSSSKIPINAPAINYGGIITVLGSASNTTQKIQIYSGYGINDGTYDPNRRQIAYRSFANNVWSAWRFVRTDFAPARHYTGKYISILGDSISTYAGYVPTGTGYATYYTGENCGVTSVDQTWWKRLIDATGMRLCINNSVSGSCMSTGARQDRISGCLPARTGGLADGTRNPNVIIIFMGINDFGHSVTMGDYAGIGDIPDDMTVFRNAYATALKAIMTNYPQAEIYICTTPHMESRSTSPVIQTVINGLSQAAFNDIIRDIAKTFAVPVIDLESCGINTGNIEQYTGDNVAAGGDLGRGIHPNAAGHELIFKKVMEYFS